MDETLGFRFGGGTGLGPSVGSHDCSEVVDLQNDTFVCLNDLILQVCGISFGQPAQTQQGCPPSHFRSIQCEGGWRPHTPTLDPKTIYLLVVVWEV